MDSSLIESAIRAASVNGVREISISRDGKILLRFQDRESKSTSGLVRGAAKLWEREFDPKRFCSALQAVLEPEGLMPTTKPVFVATEHLRRAWLHSSGAVDASLKGVANIVKSAICNGQLRGIEKKKGGKKRGWILNRDFFCCL